MKLDRLAGILLHPTSLPGKYGIGDFGEYAFQFIDFLKEAGQSLWQILPLSPTGFGDSPYQSFSTFAGNTLLISPEELIKEGYLEEDFEIPEFDPAQIDYGKVIEFKEQLYRRAFTNFTLNVDAEQKKAYSEFLEKNAYWINDYTLFMSIKQLFIRKRERMGFSEEYEAFSDETKNSLDKKEIDDYFFGGSWISWPKDILNKEEQAVKKYSEILSEEIEYNCFLQYEFSRQWEKIKTYANENGIEIIGDIPIYIAYDSADCWANKELFMLDENGFPHDVAGVPPDYFSETGQLWGNPLYDWKQMEKTEYKWWIKRIEKTHEMCDYIRIDHFRGFDTYWAVPFGEKTAVNGEWRIGPRGRLFDALNSEGLKIIAEDLGAPAETVIELRESYKLPGMKVLQFAFDSGCNNLFLPHNYDDANFVVYTGTHDNNTSVGWYSEAPEETKDLARCYMNTDGNDIAWNMARLAYSSIAAFAIVPLQDCFSLGCSARMNTPSVASGNWKWRFTEEMLAGNIAIGLRYFTKLFSRERRSKEEAVTEKHILSDEKSDKNG